MKKSIKLTLYVLTLLLPAQAQAATHATIETSMGNIQLELDEVKVPKAVANFVSYAKKGFYDNTVFHRVIDNFMIQGGGLTKKMVQKFTDKAINNEIDNGLKNNVGTIIITRTGGPNSATSRFLINTADNDFLNSESKASQGYDCVVFGKVTSGMGVVRKINKAKTTTCGLHQDIPTEAVTIRKISIK